MSNTTIWKFPLAGDVSMPAGAKPLTVQTQNGETVLWAEVDPKADMVTHRFTVVGTGWAGGLPGGRNYLATFQTGPLVFHVYDLGEGR